MKLKINSVVLLNILFFCCGYFEIINVWEWLVVIIIKVFWLLVIDVVLFIVRFIVIILCNDFIGLFLWWVRLILLFIVNE